jgi:uncharacterized protein with PIN domain
MPTIEFAFAAELIPLLDSSSRMPVVVCTFQGRQTLKHLIESLGVPHTEIGTMNLDGESISLNAPAPPGVRVVVNAADSCLLQKEEARFVIDNHLGRLAAYLRMLGLDTLYENDYSDPKLADLAAAEERILLTRDKRLLMRKAIARGAWVRSQQPVAQLRQVVRRFGLLDLVQPFRRCLRCNAPLQSVDKSAVLARLEPLTRRYYDEFHMCPGCGKIYWKGSHTARMRSIIESL